MEGGASTCSIIVNRIADASLLPRPRCGPASLPLMMAPCTRTERQLALPRPIFSPCAVPACSHGSYAAPAHGSLTRRIGLLLPPIIKVFAFFGREILVEACESESLLLCEVWSVSCCMDDIKCWPTYLIQLAQLSACPPSLSSLNQLSTKSLETKLADINIFLIQNIGMRMRTGTGGGTKYIQ